MSYSYTISETSTFTVTHAHHMAAKVAADLKRMQRFYGFPSDDHISIYEAEVVELLKAGYLGTVTYGFKRNGDWVEPMLRYNAKDLAGSSSDDDDPGRVRPGANVAGAAFSSYLTYSHVWDQLSASEKEAFEKKLPFRRGGAPEPGISGFMIRDRTYSAGGKALERETLRTY